MPMVFTFEYNEKYFLLTNCRSYKFTTSKLNQNPKNICKFICTCPIEDLRLYTAWLLQEMQFSVAVSLYKSVKFKCNDFNFTFTTGVSL